MAHRWLWDMKSSGFKKCCTQWNKSVRRLLKLDYRTHTWLLGPLTNQDHINCQLAVKSVKFCYSILHHDNTIIREIGNRSRVCSMSPIGRNMSYFRYVCGVDFNMDVHNCVASVKNYAMPSREHQALIGNASLVRDCMNGSMFIDGFDNDMLNDIFNSICVD